MIAGLSGTLALKEADRVVVKTASGVSYECFVPIRSLERLPAAGAPVELFTHLAVREDAMTLFGFVTGEERQVFQRLITASGVGPKLAMAMLSQLNADRIVRAIREKDIAILSSVSGVGKKTAERVILELKDKLDHLKGERGERGETGERDSASEMALKALAKLGYTAIEADEAVRAVLAGNGAGKDTAELVRDALAFLSTR
ncbi:MAG TPA: Holliday junction branch migration protein RuvA [Gemmatimonadales bacterium]